MAVTITGGFFVLSLHYSLYVILPRTVE